MVKYEYARVSGFNSNSTNDGSVLCTNTNEIENLVHDLLEIESLLYDAEIGKKLKLSMKHSTENPFFLDIRGVGRIGYAKWWVVNWFCEHGWEPLSDDGYFFSFKRIKDQS